MAARALRQGHQDRSNFAATVLFNFVLGSVLFGTIGTQADAAAARRTGTVSASRGNLPARAIGWTSGTPIRFALAVCRLRHRF
jgi:hypothetical protein